jgi:hypothetical protein
MEEKGKTTMLQGGAVGGPGAGSGEVSPNWGRTMDMLYDRFASENKELFEPQRIETMQGGVPGTMIQEPLAPETRRSQFFEAQPQVMAAGSELVRQRPGGAEVLHRVKTGKEKEGKPDWQVTPQDDGSYLIQDKRGWGKPSVVFPTVPVYERGPRQAKAIADRVDEAWNEAALDLADEIEAKAFERKKGLFNVQALGGESPEEYQERINEYREERFDYHLNLRGLSRRDIPKGWEAYSPATRGAEPTPEPTPQSQPTAINPETGEKVIWNGKAWVPAKQ